MKKYTLNFGQFRQFDKTFITPEKGIDPTTVTSVAFSGETLYVANAEGLFEYKDGKIKKHVCGADKLFGRDGRVFASNGNSFGEIIGGRVKKLAEFDSEVVDVSVALDGSLWLITACALYLERTENSHAS